MDAPKKRFDLNEAVIPVLTLIFGIAYFVQTRDAPRVALYWPIITAIVVAMLWLVVVVRFVFSGKVKKEAQKIDFVSKLRGERRPGLILIGSIGYLLAVPYLGFTISSFLFMLVIFKGLGSTNRFRDFLVAFTIAVFLHITFVVVMKLSLPQLHIGPFTI